MLKVNANLFNFQIKLKIFCKIHSGTFTKRFFPDGRGGAEIFFKITP